PELSIAAMHAWLIALPVAMFWLPAKAEPEFRVRPSSLAVPDGIPLGEYRRTIHPFRNWTLVYDDDLVGKTRLCDIRQEIEIVGAGVIFSWALTPTEDGSPVMKAVVPAAVGPNGRVTLTFSDGIRYEIKIAECTPVSCEGYAPAVPRTQRHIEEELP